MMGVVHVFVSGQHRPGRWNRVGDFAGRLPSCKQLDGQVVG